MSHIDAAALRDLVPAGVRGVEVRTSSHSATANDEGWLYLVAVLDLRNRLGMGRGLQAHIQTALVEDGLLMAASGAGRPCS